MGYKRAISGKTQRNTEDRENDPSREIRRDETNADKSIDSTTGELDIARSAVSERAGRTVSISEKPNPQHLKRKYDVEFSTRGQARKLHRLEQDHGSETVKRWVNEGMTVETMGKPKNMQAFRERQEARPAQIPTDVERRNEFSAQRNAGESQDQDPDGDAGAPDIVRNVISSPGKSMNESVQREMETKMGGDFSDVQIHTGPKAAAAADSINARAFTVGNHIAFNAGEYNPASSEGKKVMAHELTHVRQQTDGRVSLLPMADAPPTIGPSTDFHVQPKLEVSSPDDPAEKEAERVAERVVQMDTTTSRNGDPRGRGSDDLATRVTYASRLVQREGSADSSEQSSEYREKATERAKAASPGSTSPPNKKKPENTSKAQEEFKQLRDWLESHFAGRALAAEPWTFYEVIDAYLGPWGKGGYPINYGKKYCVKFNANDALMSNSTTSRWLKNTTLELQKALRKFILLKFWDDELVTLKESELRKAAFDSHADAYTEGGLGMVATVAPELLPTIATIPGVEFDPRSENFVATVAQVIETIGKVIPPASANLLTAVSGSAAATYGEQARRDSDRLLNQVQRSRNLYREFETVKKQIQAGKLDNIPALEHITRELKGRKGLPKPARTHAREVITIANERKRVVASKLQEAIENNPEKAEKLEAAYNNTQPGWRNWL